jgi:hypothetical protein
MRKGERERGREREKHKSMAHLRRNKEQLVEAVYKEAQMLDHLDKDFKLGITNLFKELKETMPKELV